MEYSLCNEKQILVVDSSEGILIVHVETHIMVNNTVICAYRFC